MPTPNYSNIDTATGASKGLPELPPGFSRDAQGNVVDAQNNPVKLDASGKPTASALPDGSKVIGYDDKGFPKYSTEGLDLSHHAAKNLSATSIAEGDYTPGTLVGDVVDWATDGKLSGLVGVGGGGAGSGSYDAAGELAKSEKMSGDVYDKALAQYEALLKDRAPTGQIATPDALRAKEIGTPTTLQGADADALRAQRLTQAQDAANSPSAAAAQMKANLGQISQSQMGQANMARGADRASARRDALLATGTQGMQAANQTAALSATEQAQKQQALTAALSGVQASDVAGAQALTQIGAQNQGADLQAQQATAGNTLQAQQATAQNNLAGWQAQQGAQTQVLGTGLQATGAQNQAQGVAAGHDTGMAKARADEKGSLVGAGASLVAGLTKLSDEDAKTDVSDVGASKPVDFLNWKFASDDDPTQKQRSESIISDERAKYDVSKPLTTADKATRHLQDAFGLSDERVKLDVSPTTGSGPIFDDFAERTRGMDDRDAASLLSSYENLAQSQTMPPTPHNRTWADFRGMNRDQDFPVMMERYQGLKQAERQARDGVAMLSDEQAKRDVDQMGTADLVDFAERVPLATYRYKPGAPGTDDGEDYHAGTLAQSLEDVGPLGRLMVHERDDGLKEVEYGPLGLAVGKGALAEAKEAKALAAAALAKAGRRAGR